MTDPDPIAPQGASGAIPADWWTPASVARRVRCRLDLLAEKRAAGERPGPLPLVFAREAEVLCMAAEALTDEAWAMVDERGGDMEAWRRALRGDA